VIDYFDEGKTITVVCYAELIRKLRVVITEMCQGKLHQGVLLYHDKLPAHTSTVAMAAVRDCSFERLSHPPYSIELSPCNLRVFRFLKASFRGQAFRSDENVI